MIRESGDRLSEKIMLKQKARAGCRSNHNSARSRRRPADYQSSQDQARSWSLRIAGSRFARTTRTSLSCKPLQQAKQPSRAQGVAAGHRPADGCGSSDRATSLPTRSKARFSSAWSGASSGLRCDQLIQHQIDVFLRKAQSREVSLNKQPLQVLIDRSDFDLPHACSPRRQTFLDTPHDANRSRSRSKIHL